MFGSQTDLSLYNPDWLQLADAFGWHGQAVANARDLTPALKKAVDYVGPSLVVIPIDYCENLILSEMLGHSAPIRIPDSAMSAKAILTMYETQSNHNAALYCVPFRSDGDAE